VQLDPETACLSSLDIQRFNPQAAWRPEFPEYGSLKIGPPLNFPKKSTGYVITGKFTVAIILTWF